MKHLVLKEYKYIAIAEKDKLDENGNELISYNEDGNVFVLEETFHQIETFVLSSNDDADQFLKLESRKKQKRLIAKNYVGVIETKDGTVIEILPKIHDLEDEDGKDTRKVFLQMLRYLKDSPYKQMDFSHLKASSMPLMEIFITMFLNELSILIKKGIKHDYIPIAENSGFVKGKIKWAEHINKNIVHKERFYVEFDEYLCDRPENRLIKSTLLLLKRKTKSLRNQKLVSEYSFIFDTVHPSANYISDFAKVKTDRTMKDYERVLSWCKVFLNNETFTNFKGKDIAFALLFPMERIFEDYVAAYIRKNFSDWHVKTQDRRHYLVDKHDGHGKFRLRPDIVMEKNDEIIVLDTKWKLIDQNQPKNNYLISQSDMYQLFAYGKKYERSRNTIKLVLIYPHTTNFLIPLNNFEYSNYPDEKDLHLSALPFNIVGSFEQKRNWMDCVVLNPGL